MEYKSLENGVPWRLRHLVPLRFHTRTTQKVLHIAFGTSSFAWQHMHYVRVSANLNYHQNPTIEVASMVKTKNTTNMQNHMQKPCFK